MNSMKKVISTKNAPEAVGAYSQAVQAGAFIFLSGQIPLDPITMKIVDGGIQEQTHQVFKNLQAVIQAANCTFANVVRLSIYMTDLSHFSVVNEIMEMYFEGLELPARATVEVKALPKNAEIEIDGILYCG